MKAKCKCAWWDLKCRLFKTCKAGVLRLGPASGAASWLSGAGDWAAMVAQLGAYSEAAANMSITAGPRGKAAGGVLALDLATMNDNQLWGLDAGLQVRMVSSRWASDTWDAQVGRCVIAALR